MKKKLPKRPTTKFMLARLMKHLGLKKEEVIEEAIKEMFAGTFNE